MIAEDSYKKFKAIIDTAVLRFNQFDRNKAVRLLSHADADGITACSILMTLLNKLGFTYSLSFVDQLRSNIIQELSYEDYCQYIFCDIGSNQLAVIKDLLKSKKVIILDHHVVSETQLPEEITLVNPCMAGLMDKELSASGIVYLFSKLLLPSVADMAHIAFIGALGDMQNKHGLSELNNAILDDAVSAGKISVRYGIKLFGAQSKSLVALLEYGVHPYIAGVTGSENSVVKFLQKIGINPKREKGLRRLDHLTKEELDKLAKAVVNTGATKEKVEDLLGDVYMLPNEARESPMRDANEFSTLLNACGRLNKVSSGIGACLGDENCKEKALKCFVEYKSKLLDAVSWYEANKNTGNVIMGKGYIILNAQDHILPTIIGTLASIVSKSNNLPDNTMVLGMAHLIDNTTKASLRISGNRNDKHLYNILSEITAAVGGEAGGHKDAAGANILTLKEDEFIEAAKRILEQRAMEEAIMW